MDDTAGICGMNHFMLPEAVNQQNVFGSEAGRYGIQAMELLLNEMIIRGAAKNRLWAKLFGGGHVIESMNSSQIPESNIATAVTFLETENIPVLAQDVGGTNGRKVSFFTGTGKVLVEKVKKTEVTGIDSKETRFRQRLQRDKKGEFVLFDRRLRA